MHYKLFLNVAFTTAWGGNSPGVFKEFYKRLVTKPEARQYWTMLPTWLKQRGEIEVELPKNHKLDSAITEGVQTTVSATRAAMNAFRQDVTATDARADAPRSAKTGNTDIKPPEASAVQIAGEGQKTVILGMHKDAAAI